MKHEMSREAEKLVAFLTGRPPNFTYDQARSITGVNDLARLRGYLATAFRRVKKLGIWYQVERGVGYRLLSEDGKNPVQSVRLDRVKRHVGRIDRDQETIRFEGLSHDGKMAFTFVAARVGRLKEAASLKTQRKIKRDLGNNVLPLLKRK